MANPSSGPLSWLWPALIVAALGLPLFVGLGGRDVRGDEAIYSFAVDRMLETGDWLTPRSSPHEDELFFEKPPLKVWMVAGAIRAGLLPHDEFGLRFWDALFGAIAFVYVFAIGRRLAGPFCGAVATLLLFVHGPLIGEHGLRGNTMEAPLFLSYCAGVYHYLAWAAAEGRRPRAGHAVAVCLWFVLGFMTKFVAALFLPLMLGVATLAVPAYRARLAQDWHAWLGGGAVALVLIAPWFVYQHVAHGDEFWRILLAEHVYIRFTRYLHPSHLQPWHYYFTQVYVELAASSSAGIVVTGAAVLLVATVRWRWPEGFLVLLWFVLPLTLMSFGTSKVYHYAFPFLPPAALAGGYLLDLLLGTLWSYVNRTVALVHRSIQRPLPRLAAFTRRPVVRLTLLVVATVALAVAAATVVYGPIRIAMGDVVVRNSGVVRPALVALILMVLAGTAEPIVKALVLVAVLALLPIAQYRQSFDHLLEERHPLRTARDCVLRLQTAGAQSPPALYVDAPNVVLRHEDFYYFRRVRPWERPEGEEPSDALLTRRLFAEGDQRPVLVGEARYQVFLAQRQGSDPRDRLPRLVSFEDVLLLLPGPYAACGPDGSDRSRMTDRPGSQESGVTTSPDMPIFAGGNGCLPVKCPLTLTP